MEKPLIENIEINYFRSIHKGKLVQCRPLNIIVGGNDSGKSNVLRALNLFFNNHTDLGVSYNFERDLSIKRRKETRRGKTRNFLYVKITFNNILNYKSLPQQFIVKRQWNRYSQTPEDYYSSKEKKKLNPATVTKFLNSIRLHYVPAVKSREIFRYYLELLHDALAQRNLNLSDASENLTDVINKATIEMSDKIRKDISISSRISVPSDFRMLFSNLDFMTKFNEQEEVPLRQRGDGIQASHIPYILDFIGKEREDKASIWIYEEPENSLEMGKAFSLAEKFSKDFIKRNQIFLTTHSPAFYSLSGESISTWKISKISERVENFDFDISKITALPSMPEIDDDLGITPLVADRAKELMEEKKRLDKEISMLQSTIKPVILCEGKTDIQYIKKAIHLYDMDYILDTCDLREAKDDNRGSGCDNLKKIKKYIMMHPDLFPRRTLFIFDVDVSDERTSSPDERISIFKFEKTVGNSLEAGIENLLPRGLLKEITDNDKFYDERSYDGGFKTVRELNKGRVCQFVCGRNDKNDFINFSDLLSHIKEWVKK